MKQTESNKVNLITKKLDDACIIDFGTRVVQKKDGGNIYPVYGGGGATFKVNTYNRENCLVVSRFAMSKQCTRFVEGKFYLNDSGLTVRPKNEKELAQKYLDYLLLTLNDTIYSLSRGTAQRNLNVSKFRNLIINYPDSIELQLHIANLLSKAENLIAQRKESIRLLDEFLKSTFLEMFGDPVRNEKGWNIGKFKDLAILDRKQVLPSEFTKEDFYIGLEDIEKETGNIIKTSSENAEDLKSSKFRFTSNHILYAKLRPYLNKVALPYQSGICSTDIFPVLPLEGKSNRFFICYLMRSKPFVTEMHSKSSGANLPRASASVIENFKTYQPPIGLQTQFAQIVEKTEALKTQYQQSLQELENLYGSLSQKAFRGELSVKQNNSITS